MQISHLFTGVGCLDARGCSSCRPGRWGLLRILYPRFKPQYACQPSLIPGAVDKKIYGMVHSRNKLFWRSVSPLATAKGLAWLTPLCQEMRYNVAHLRLKIPDAHLSKPCNRAGPEGIILLYSTSLKETLTIRLYHKVHELSVPKKNTLSANGNSKLPR